jgi:hypothetical protein
MDLELLGKQRCEIIEKSINIESLINLVIGHHYFKRHNQSFLEEMLADEAFSFGLRVNVLSKISPSFNGLGRLHRVIRIRNRFAHCHPFFADIDSSGKEKRVAIDPKNPRETLDFDVLYAEFNKLYPSVEKELVELLKAKGGKLEPWNPTPMQEDGA